MKKHFKFVDGVLQECKKNDIGSIEYDHDEKIHKNVEAKHLVLQNDGLHDMRHHYA